MCMRACVHVRVRVPASLPASLPACQPASLPASLPACQPASLYAHTKSVCQPACTRTPKAYTMSLESKGLDPTELSRLKL